MTLPVHVTLESSQSHQSDGEPYGDLHEAGNPKNPARRSHVNHDLAAEAQAHRVSTMPVLILKQIRGPRLWDEPRKKTRARVCDTVE